jgi:vanillate O-demethylase ferredoxin subunit
LLGEDSVAKRFLEVVVTGIRQLTPRVREYLLASADGSDLPAYAPGAHVELHTTSPSSGPIVRHYSLVGGTGLWDDPAHTYRIAVQREDRARGSAHIHDSFTLGTRLQVSVPKNNFALDRRDAKSLLIAGGIGITPILSMLRSVVRRHRDLEMVYAGRHASAMAYREDVLRLAEGRARIHDSSVSGHLDLRALLARQPEGCAAYVCGPAAMVEAAQAAAAELGWAPGRVRSELFTAGPTGDEQPFEVELRRSQQRVRVGRDTTILDALTAAGIHPLHDCRRGECGLCPMTVLEADGPIQHRDTYLSDEEHASQKTLCICVSRIQGSRLVLDA